MTHRNNRQFFQVMTGPDEPRALIDALHEAQARLHEQALQLQQEQQVRDAERHLVRDRQTQSPTFNSDAEFLLPSAVLVLDAPRDEHDSVVMQMLGCPNTRKSECIERYAGLHAHQRLGEVQRTKTITVHDCGVQCDYREQAGDQLILTGNLNPDGTYDGDDNFPMSLLDGRHIIYVFGQPEAVKEYVSQIQLRLAADLQDSQTFAVNAEGDLTEVADLAATTFVSTIKPTVEAVACLDGIAENAIKMHQLLTQPENELQFGM